MSKITLYAVCLIVLTSVLTISCKSNKLYYVHINQTSNGKNW